MQSERQVSAVAVLPQQPFFPSVRRLSAHREADPSPALREAHLPLYRLPPWQL